MARLIEEHLQTVIDIKDLVSSVFCLCSTGDDSDESSSSRTDIVVRVKDFIRMIPRDNKKKSMELLKIFEFCGAPDALVSLFNSPIKVSQFCALLRGAAACGEPVYYSCRETLGSLLKSIGFANRLRYFGTTKSSDLIEDLHPFVCELSFKLMDGLYTIKTSSSVSTSFRLSFESDIREFTLFSLHLRRAIEEHFRSKGQSLPLCLDDNFDEHHPCYLEQIHRFHCNFHYLLRSIKMCMDRIEYNVKFAGVWEFNHGWSYYLSILKELNNISKLYQGAEDELSNEMRSYQFSLDTLVMYSKRSDDHQWLLKHKNVIDFESRSHLMMMMFPEVKDDTGKLHRMLIDRSQLLTESFEHIAHANPKSLRNGLFMEFKGELATGHGVLREWLFLVCQALFNPQNSLFLACPSDWRRFFPNPAKVDARELNYFGFCGQVIALALMHKVQVGIAFDRVFFLQLAGDVISLEDIRDADPCLYKSCKKILEMDADFMDSDAMGLTFVKEIEEFGSRKIVELCPGGDTMVVNSKNREEYVHLLIQHCFVKSISKKVSYFARGFGDMLCKRRLQKIFFQSLDLKDLDRMLLGSDKAICVNDWKAHTDYDDYKETDDQICWFWKVVEGMSSVQQRELLFFWTSVKYLPANGFSGLPSRLYIYKTPGSDYRLPSSHTCFYRLSLPHYPFLAVMQQHLFLICQEHVGCSFGFS
ncbi:HECT [Macleaya cordata]|uniref:HECT-type E3 ubiquitin transferase n=1 Tax=Macleaya cordata TaxID=56857 RepID=A0A200PS50_MACCD|nr:HECT [Macleaya cordata]